MSAVIRQFVMRKRAAAADAEAFALQREQLIAEAKGKKGDQGEQGDPGPMPGHEWKGGKLRFQKPDGKWGKFVDLKGKQGEPGAARVLGIPSSGSDFNPASLAPLDGAPTLADYLIIERDGVPYRIPVAALQPLFGGSSPAPANTATVNGAWLTVNGEYITVT